MGIRRKIRPVRMMGKNRFISPPSFTFYVELRIQGLLGSSDLIFVSLAHLNPCLPAGPEPGMVQGRQAGLLAPYG
jgi:hypothetical protein